MSVQKISPRTVPTTLITVLVAGLQVLTQASDHLRPMANFTPVGAMALFGGACFTGKARPFVFPLLTLFLSDVVLAFTVFSDFRSGLLYGGWYWTYLAFALMVAAGKFLVKDLNARSVFLSVMVATLIHWLVSDVGGCLNEATTQAALARYGQRLLVAIPHEWNFLAGTLVYSVVLFGGFELQQRANNAKINHPA